VLGGLAAVEKDEETAPFRADGFGQQGQGLAQDAVQVEGGQQFRDRGKNGDFLGSSGKLFVRHGPFLIRLDGTDFGR
jgi:hypothetical protein